MELFSAHDVVQFAIRIEENGEAFYLEAERKAICDDAKALFRRLAAEEIEHRKVFERMLDKLGDFKPPESYQGEYMACLRGHIDGRAVFKGGGEPDAGSTLTALDFAIQRELDSMLYYQELKRVVPVREQKVLDAIIDEERIHFAQLWQTRQEYA
jgi:rubrerythrin